MLTLLKNLECYTPRFIGKNDILVCGTKIERIGPSLNFSDAGLVQTEDCDGLCAFPAFIDQHVHIIGGGGEQGFASRLPEIRLDEIVSAGVATVVGLLGADSCTRSLEGLFAKAKSLEAQGLTTYLYTGSYAVPPVTFTGSVDRDLVLIDKVIGVGEIAISDHRSSHCGPELLLRTASQAHLGGLLGGKAGVVHLHMGDGRQGLKPLLRLLEDSELPKDEFVPTHVNRNERLFRQALEYCRGGGRIDLTSGETAGISVPDALRRILSEGVDPANVTVSSDANGSNPGGGINRAATLLEDIVRSVVDRKLSPEIVFSLVTENVAKLLKLYPKKGSLQLGSDADILLMDRKYRIRKLFGSGKLLKKF
jgi:beta-aspartyl-dipeptidase (metallo-type)